MANDNNIEIGFSLSSETLATFAGLSAVLGLASKAASDQEAALLRLSTVFKSATGDVNDFTKQVQKSNLALGDLDVKDVITEFKILGDSFGLSQTEAVKFSKEFTQLSSDLSKFTGRGVKDILERLRSGLLNGADATQELGISFTEADVRRASFAAGLGEDLSLLSASELAQLRIQLILKASNGIAEKAATLNGTFSQSISELTVQFEKLQVEVGKSTNEYIKPFIQNLTSGTKSLSEFAKANPTAVKHLAEFALLLGAASVAMGGLVIGLKAAKFATDAYTASQVAAAGATGAAADQIIAQSIATKLLAGALTAANYAVGIFGAAIVGWSIGRAISDVFGLEEHFTDFGKTLESVRQAYINLDNSAGLTEARVKSVTDAVATGAKIQESSLSKILYPVSEAKAYARNIEIYAENTEQATAQITKFTEGLSKGLAPAQAFAQAVNEVADAEAKSGVVAGETAKEREAAIELTIREREKIKDLKKEIKELNEQREENANKEKPAAERAQIEKSKATNSLTVGQNKEVQDLILKQGDLKAQIILEEDAREKVKKKIEEQKKADEDRLQAIESATKSAKDSENSLADARVRMTKSLDDDLALMDQRRILEEKDAKSVQEKEQIIRKFMFERQRLQLENAAKIKEENEKLAQDAINAELDLQQAIAETTDELKDDLDVMNLRLAAELKLATSARERLNIIKKFAAEEQKITLEAKKRREDEAKEKKKSANEFAKNSEIQQLRNQGKEGEADIISASSSVEGEIKNVVDQSSLNDFKRGSSASFENALKGSRDRVTNASSNLEEAQAALKEGKRNAVESKERKQLEQNVIAAQQELRKSQEEYVKNSEFAAEEQKRLEELAKKQLEAKKQETAAAELTEKGVSAENLATDNGLDPLTGEALVGDQLASQLTDQANGAGALPDALSSNVEAQASLTEGLDNWATSLTEATVSQNEKINSLVEKLATLTQQADTLASDDSNFDPADAGIGGG